MKRWLKRGGIAFGVLVLLIVAFYLEENWRGARLWAETKAQYEAKGFSFDPKALIPPPVPDEQNFAKSEIWQHLLASRDPKKEIRPQSSLMDARKILQEWRTANKVRPNWELGQKPISPPLALLDSIQGELNQLYAAANERSQCQFSFDLNFPFPPATPLPELGPAMNVAQIVQAHALASLNNKDTITALRDISICYLLAQGGGQQPTLISGLSTGAIALIPLPTLWSGIESHQWSDSDLSHLQSLLGSINLFQTYRTSMRGELTVYFIGTIDWFKKHRLGTSKEFAALASLGGELDSDWSKWPNPCSMILSISPSGWYDETKAIATPCYIDHFLNVLDSDQRRFSPEKNFSQKDLWALRSYQPTRAIFSLSLPALNEAGSRFAKAQSQLDLARVACGLERYRLANGKYPAALAELEPKFIDQVPHDLCNAEPLHYRVEADGNYALYSVGFNGVDDGGQVVMKKEFATAIDPKQGDWVWPRLKR